MMLSCVASAAAAAAVLAEGGAVVAPDHQNDDQDDDPPPAVAEGADAGRVARHNIPPEIDFAAFPPVIPSYAGAPKAFRSSFFKK